MATKTKKDIRLELAKRLEETFADLKKRLGNDRFKRNIRRASKALAAKLQEAQPPKKNKKKVAKPISAEEKSAKPGS